MVAHRSALYVFGGEYQDGTFADVVDRLDVPGLAWTTLAPLSNARVNVAAAVVGDEIHVFGGFISSFTAVGTHEYLLVPP